MPKILKVEGVGDFSVPDDWTDDMVAKAVNNYKQSKLPGQAPVTAQPVSAPIAAPEIKPRPLPESLVSKHDAIKSKYDASRGQQATEKLRSDRQKFISDAQAEKDKPLANRILDSPAYAGTQAAVGSVVDQVAGSAKKFNQQVYDAAGGLGYALQPETVKQLGELASKSDEKSWFQTGKDILSGDYSKRLAGSALSKGAGFIAEKFPQVNSIGKALDNWATDNRETSDYAWDQLMSDDPVGAGKLGAIAGKVDDFNTLVFQDLIATQLPTLMAGRLGGGAASTAVYSLSQARAAAREVLDKTGDDAMARQTFALTLGVGIGTESIIAPAGALVGNKVRPISKFLAATPTGKRVLESLSRAAGSKLGKKFSGEFGEKLAKDVGFEALQEGLENTAQNLIASDIVGWDPDRQWSDGLQHSMIYGGLGGGLIGSGYHFSKQTDAALIRMDQYRDALSKEDRANGFAKVNTVWHKPSGRYVMATSVPHEAGTAFFVMTEDSASDDSGWVEVPETDLSDKPEKAVRKTPTPIPATEFDVSKLTSEEQTNVMLMSSTQAEIDATDKEDGSPDPVKVESLLVAKQESGELDTDILSEAAMSKATVDLDSDEIGRLQGDQNKATAITNAENLATVLLKSDPDQQIDKEAFKTMDIDTLNKRIDEMQTLVFDLNAPEAEKDLRQTIKLIADKSGTLVDVDSIAADDLIATADELISEAVVKPSERPPDIIDAIQERFGAIKGKGQSSQGEAGYYGDNYKEVLSGPAKKLIKNTTDSSSFDETLEFAISEGLLPEGATVDDLQQALVAANKSRRATKDVRKSETAQLQADVASRLEFETHAFTETEGDVAVSVSGMHKGDVLTIDGEAMTVESLTFDGNGEPQSVTLRGGTKFGNQSVESDQTVYAQAFNQVDQDVSFLEESEVDAPQLKSNQEQGDLLGNIDEDFQLIGEKGTDTQRIQAAKEAQERDLAESARLQGELIPPSSAFISEATIAKNPSNSQEFSARALEKGDTFTINTRPYEVTGIRLADLANPYESVVQLSSDKYGNQTIGEDVVLQIDEGSLERNVGGEVAGSAFVQEAKIASASSNATARAAEKGKSITGQDRPLLKEYFDAQQTLLSGYHVAVKSGDNYESSRLKESHAYVTTVLRAATGVGNVAADILNENPDHVFPFDESDLQTFENEKKAKPTKQGSKAPSVSSSKSPSKPELDWNQDIHATHTEILQAGKWPGVDGQPLTDEERATLTGGITQIEHQNNIFGVTGKAVSHQRGVADPRDQQEQSKAAKLVASAKNVTKLILDAIQVSDSAPITWDDIAVIVAEYTGGSMEDGAFSREDVENVLEVALNNIMRKDRRFSSGLSVQDVGLNQEVLDNLVNLERLLPDRPSIPRSIAYVASDLLGVKPDDVVLAPKAGTGSLVSFVWSHVKAVIANEFSVGQYPLLDAQSGFFTATTQYDAENDLYDRYDDYISEGVLLEPTAVIIQPPVPSVTNASPRSKQSGIRHILQGLRTMADGGRLVAIVDANGGLKGAGLKGAWRELKSKYNVRADIGIEGGRIIVIDKTGRTINSEIRSKNKIAMKDVFAELEGLRNDRGTVNLTERTVEVSPEVESEVTPSSEADLLDEFVVPPEPGSATSDSQLPEWSVDGKAVSVKLIDSEILQRDPMSGETTSIVEVETEYSVDLMSWEMISTVVALEGDHQFVTVNPTGKKPIISVLIKTGTREGSDVILYERVSTTDTVSSTDSIQLGKLKSLQKITDQEAKVLWDSQYESEPRTSTRKDTFITGASPVVPRADLDQFKVTPVEGQAFDGTLLPKKEERKFRESIAARPAEITPFDVYTRVSNGESFTLADGWSVLSPIPNSDGRLEVVVPSILQVDLKFINTWKTEYGGFTQATGRRSQFFLPSDPSITVPALATIIAQHPIEQNADTSYELMSESDKGYPTTESIVPQGTYTLPYIIDQLLPTELPEGFKSVLEMFKSNGLNVPVIITTVGDYLANHPNSGVKAGDQGSYHSKEQAIYIFTDAQSQAAVILHEALHAALKQVIDTNVELRQVLDALLAQARKHLGKKKDGSWSYYGLNNVHDFVSEVFVNEALQRALHSIKAGKDSLWSMFISWVNRVFNISREDNIAEKLVSYIQPFIQDPTVEQAFPEVAKYTAMEAKLEVESRGLARFFHSILAKSENAFTQILSPFQTQEFLTATDGLETLRKQLKAADPEVEAENRSVKSKVFRGRLTTASISFNEEEVANWQNLVSVEEKADKIVKNMNSIDAYRTALMEPNQTKKQVTLREERIEELTADNTKMSGTSYFRDNGVEISAMDRSAEMRENRVYSMNQAAKAKSLNLEHFKEVFTDEAAIISSVSTEADLSNTELDENAKKTMILRNVISMEVAKDEYNRFLNAKVAAQESIGTAIRQLRFKLKNSKVDMVFVREQMVSTIREVKSVLARQGNKAFHGLSDLAKSAEALAIFIENISKKLGTDNAVNAELMQWFENPLATIPAIDPSDYQISQENFEIVIAAARASSKFSQSISGLAFAMHSDLKLTATEQKYFTTAKQSDIIGNLVSVNHMYATKNQLDREIVNYNAWNEAQKTWDSIINSKAYGQWQQDMLDQSGEFRTDHMVQTDREVVYIGFNFPPDGDGNPRVVPDLRISAMKDRGIVFDKALRDRLQRFVDSIREYEGEYEEARLDWENGRTSVTPEQAGYSKAVYKSLRVAKENIDIMAGGLISQEQQLAPGMVAAKLRGTRIFQQVYASLEHVSGFFGAKMKNAIFHVSDSRARVNEIADEKKFQKIGDLRIKAFASHALLSPEQYREWVQDPIGRMGRQFGGSLEVGAALLGSPIGTLVTQADMDFFNLSMERTNAMTEEGGEIQATYTKGDKGYRRAAAPAGDKTTARRTNKIAFRFETEIAEAHAEGAVFNTQVDLSNGSTNPIVQIFNDLQTNHRFISNHVLDIVHKDRTADIEVDIAHAYRQLVGRFQTGEITHSDITSLDDLIDLVVPYIDTILDPLETYEYVRAQVVSEFNDYKKTAIDESKKGGSAPNVINQLGIIDSQSQFTKPAAKQHYPSPLYSYGPLSDFEFNEEQGLVTSRYVTEFAKSIEQGIKQAESARVKMESRVPPDDPDLKLLDQEIKIFRLLLKQMAEPDIGRSTGWARAAEWFFNAHVGSVLMSVTSATLNLFGAAGAYNLFYMKVGRISRIHTWLKRVHLGKISYVVHTGHFLWKLGTVGAPIALSNFMGELASITGLSKASKNFLKGLRRKHPAIFKSLIDFVEKHYKRMVTDKLDTLIRIGLLDNRSLKGAIHDAFHNTGTHFTYNPTEIHERDELKATPEGTRKLIFHEMNNGRRIAARVLTETFKFLGQRSVDIGVNVVSLGVTGSLEEDLMKMSQAWYHERSNAGLSGFTPSDPEWQARSDEWDGSKTNTRIGFLKHMLNLAGMNLEVQMHDYIQRLQSDPDADFFGSDNKLEGLQRVVLADINAATPENRSLVTQKSQWARSLLTLQGYAGNFLQQVTSATMVEAKGSQDDEPWRKMLRFMMKSFMAVFGFGMSGVISKTARDVYEREILGKYRDLPVFWERNFWTRDLSEMFTSIMIFPALVMPYIGGAYMFLSDSGTVGGRGFDISQQSFPLSVATSAAFMIEDTRRLLTEEGATGAYLPAVGYVQRFSPLIRDLKSIAENLDYTRGLTSWNSGMNGLRKGLIKMGQEKRVTFIGEFYTHGSAKHKRNLLSALTAIQEAKAGGDESKLESARAAAQEAAIGMTQFVYDQKMAQQDKLPKKRRLSPQDVRKSVISAVRQAYMTMDPRKRANQAKVIHEDDYKTLLSHLSPSERQRVKNIVEAYGIGLELFPTNTTYSEGGGRFTFNSVQTRAAKPIGSPASEKVNARLAR